MHILKGFGTYFNAGFATFIAYMICTQISLILMAFAYKSAENVL